MSTSLSVVVLTHDDYFKWLDEILWRIHLQRQAIDECIVVVNSDSVPASGLLQSCGFKVVRGKFPSPNDARNAGLAAVRTEWACYVDGDNVPDWHYFERMKRLAAEAGPAVAVIYPDIMRVRPDGRRKLLKMPPWDYWACRERSIVDTCSAWRVPALRSVGGWFTPAACLQDYATVLRLTRAGWRARKAPALVATLRDHDANLHKQSRHIPEVTWHAKSFAIVTAFAGRYACLDSLASWYRNECFPPHSRFVWLDDSNDAKFHARLRRICVDLMSRGIQVELLRADSTTKKLSGFMSIHTHVGNIYTRIVSSIAADIYVFVEDDVIAPRGGLRQLLGSPAFFPGSRWAGVSAVYPSRADSTCACASESSRRWRRISIHSIPPRLVEMGMIGAGFSAWNGAALLKTLPLRPTLGEDGYTYGWDGTLCRDLQKRGYRIGLEGSVRCLHMTE